MASGRRYEHSTVTGSLSVSWGRSVRQEGRRGVRRQPLHVCRVRGSLLAHSPGERLDILTIDENSIAELFYTSGSTGTPKGVMLSHRTLYLHALSVAGSFNHDDNAVELHTIPLFHANGWGRPQASTMM